MHDPTAQEFINLLKEQFEPAERTRILPDAVIRSLPSWSSLQALIVTVALHEKYGITLTDVELRSAQTVRDLYHLVIKKQEG